MKIGLIGYGYWGGGFVARNIARVADLAVIVDPDPSRMVSASEAWAPWGVRVASEPEVAFDTCDAVWIATPVQTHTALIEAALDSGLHVMCEKPFVMDAGEADRLCEQAESKGLVIMAGHLSLFTAAHARARMYINGGYSVVETLRQTDRASISDHSVAWGLGPHDIAALVDLYGEPEASAWSGNTHRAHATLSFKEATATASFDWLGTERERSFQIDGKEFAETPNEREPLLAEAQHFSLLCRATEATELVDYQRQLVRQVTAVLERAESLVQA